MDRNNLASSLDKVADFFINCKYEEAIDLLQECIKESRVDSKEFMERLRDETKDPQTSHKLTHMYFLNFV